MAEDEFDEEEPDLEDDDVEVDDLVEDDLDLDDEDDVLDVLVDEEEDETDVTGGVEVPTPPATLTTTAEEEDDEIVDLDEELHPDDVEEPLDVLLQERTAANTLEDDEDVEDEEVETDDRGEGTSRILPRRADEFLCSSCFLVLPRTQLADEAKMVCRDCA